MEGVSASELMSLFVTVFFVNAFFCPRYSERVLGFRVLRIQSFGVRGLVLKLDLRFLGDAVCMALGRVGFVAQCRILHSMLKGSKYQGMRMCSSSGTKHSCPKSPNQFQRRP